MPATQDIKISAIPQTASLANTDLFVVVKSPASSPTTNTVTLNTLRSLVLETISTSNTITVGNATVYSTVNATSVNSSSISSTNSLITSNTGLSLGSFSVTANGYSYMPNGLIMQWGTVSANTTTGNATFPIAFPTACRAVTMNTIGSANIAYHAAAANTTIAQIRTSSTTTAISVQYTAIGY